MQIDILGASYTIEKKPYAADKNFENSDGYCDWYRRKICYCDLRTAPEWANATNDGILIREQSIIRHEILHAFLYESGLSQDSHAISAAWVFDEEIIDWFALQGPKILKAWQEAGALS